MKTSNFMLLSSLTLALVTGACNSKNLAPQEVIFMATANAYGLIVSKAYKGRLGIGEVKSVEGKQLLTVTSQVTDPTDGKLLLNCNGATAIPNPIAASAGETIEVGQIACENQMTLHIAARTTRGFATRADQGFVTGYDLITTILDSRLRPLGSFVDFHVERPQL